MSVYAVTVRSTGWDGAPGFNTYYFFGLGTGAGVASATEAAAAATLVDGWLGQISSAIADEVTMTRQGDIVARNTETGEGIQVFTETENIVAGAALGDVLPTASTPLVNWRTVFFGPRGRGRTFLPPTTEGFNEPSGAPGSALLTDINNAVDMFLSASQADLNVDFVIWSRPVFEGDPPVLTRDGLANEVTSGAAAAQWAVLRSRRD